MYSQFSCRNTNPQVSKFSSTPLKTFRNTKNKIDKPPLLLKVQSPSTSYSPFRVSDQRIPLRQLNCPLPPKSPGNCNYYRKQIDKEDLLDETINKLNFLEKKIANIMEKNDQLRSHLRRTDQDSSLEQFSYYLSHPVSQVQTSKTRNSSEFSAKITVQTTTSPEQSIISHREQNHQHKDNSNSKTPSVGRCQKSNTPSVGRFQKSNSSQIRQNTQIINGRGKKYYENMYVYEGDFLNYLREGNGTLQDSQGIIVYQGQWKNDQFNGRGKFTNLDYLSDKIDIPNFKEFKLVQHQFITYEGEFKDGQFHGQGKMTFQGEDNQLILYSGGFALDGFHGLGILSQQGEELLKGKWLYGCFV